MTNLFKKAAVCTDIHWGLKSNSLVHNRDCEAFIDWFIAKAKEEGCETGMFLGDWHNHRASINLQTLQFSVRALEKLSAAFDTFYFIPGNHDLYYRDNVTSTVLNGPSIFLILLLSMIGLLVTTLLLLLG